jgi:hypothetical protein
MKKEAVIEMRRAAVVEDAEKGCDGGRGWRVQ